MKKYISPELELLLFTEEEICTDLVATSGEVILDLNGEDGGLGL